MAQDEDVSIYRELSRIPSLTAAQVIDTAEGFVTVSSIWSQKDLERGSTFKFKRTYLIKEGEASFETVLPVLDATELHEESLSSFSPCGKFQAVLRQIKNKKGEDQQYLEIWNKQSKVQNVNLTVVDKHGKVYKDDEFGCLNWSSDSGRIVYVAEKKQPKTASYFEKKADQADVETDSSKDPIKGDQYLFQDDWGETLVDKCCPVICMYDVVTEAVTVLEGVPEDLSPAQASWGPNDAGIVFSALYNEPYKLGAVYCDNRRSAIFHLILESKQCDILSAVDKCCRAPRCSPDQSKLVYLRNDVGGPHQHCKQLMMYDWTTQTSSVVVDVIQKPKDGDSFPGLFLNNLPLRCWAGDNQTVILDTLWRTRQHILAINVSTRKETLLTLNDSYPSSTVLDVKGNILLAKRAAPNKSGRMVICDTSKVTEGLDWFVLEDNIAEFEDISWKHFSLPQPDGFQIEGVLFAPSASIGQEQQPPLVVFPHGGPHSSIISTYLILPAFLCKLNYVVILVNYRGSTGYGQDAIFSLPGKVGTQDVSDVHLMSTHVLKEGYGDPTKVLVTGGSHGGFLSLHMIGQYPDFYKVCAVRNPVCNIADMVGSTDIPDWCLVEAGVEFSYDFVPSSSIYQEMLQKSPVVHIDKVKAPTLLLIGREDLRVPPKQGEHYYKFLRARNIKSKLLLYPENNHGLVKVEAESDCLINIHRWFQENL